MKTFKLYIDLENDIFQEDPTHEVARLLRIIAEKLETEDPEDFSHYRTIFDLNGNDVGRYAIKELPVK